MGSQTAGGDVRRGSTVTRRKATVIQMGKREFLMNWASTSLKTCLRKRKLRVSKSSGRGGIHKRGRGESIHTRGIALALWFIAGGVGSKEGVPKRGREDLLKRGGGATPSYSGPLKAPGKHPFSEKGKKAVWCEGVRLSHRRGLVQKKRQPK